jgi:hypothetical protein
MIRIRLEGETWRDVQNQAREIGGCAIPFEEIEAENVAAIAADVADNPVMPPPVEPVDKGEFRPIPAIDALPPAPPPPAATAAPDVDARGIPWDGRIHAGNKATTKVGDWKRRRGVSVEEVQRIEAGLVSPAPTTSTVSNPSSTAHTMQAPPPPPAPAELPGTEPPPVTFDQVMREAGQRNLGITNLNALAAEVTGGQIGQIALIADKPAYIQAVYDRMTAS